MILFLFSWFNDQGRYIRLNGVPPVLDEKGSLLQMFRRMVFVFSVVVVLVTAIGVQAQTEAAWTFMHYFALDNNLESQVFGDLIEITNVGSTDDVNIVAQVDRAV